MDSRAQSDTHPHTLILRNWIAGKPETTGSSTESRNPGDRDDIVALAPVTGPDDVRRACEAAKGAQGRWAARPAPGRAQILGRLGKLLTQRKEALSQFVSREMGKPIKEARGSVQEAIDTAEFFQSEGRR